MKNQAHLFILPLTILVSVFSSCSSQSQPKQDREQTMGSPTIENTIDTSLWLKYTSGIRSILEDSKGNIWFGSHQEGVCLFDGKSLTYFTTEDGLSDNQIRSIYEDANGIVWFEGGEGISSYDAQRSVIDWQGKKIITHTEKNYRTKEEWQSGPNDLWFKGDETVGYNATERNYGVYRYDGNTLNFHLFPLTIEEGDDWTYSVSTPFSRGKNGMVWFGTYGAALGYDGENFTIIDNQSLELNEQTGYLHIRSIFEDSKGKLWIGNNGIGVLLYDGDITINFSKSQGLVSENSLNSGGYRSPPGSLEHVFSIGEDTNGNIWFGDRDTGAWSYDGNAMRNYTTADGLTTTHIWKIYNTTKGELWFAMNDGSVLKFNGISFDRVF